MFRERDLFHISTNPAHCHPPSLDRLNKRYFHFMEPVKEEFVGARVLDLGCHNGKFSHASYQLGAKEVWGIDNDPSYIQQSKKNIPHGNFDIRDCSSIKHLGEFDIILCLGILYYVEPLPLLVSLREVCLKLLIIDTFTSPYIDQEKLVGTVPNKWMLERWIVEAGFQFQEARPSSDMPSNYHTIRSSYWCKPVRIIL